jgi:hypothetical protein
MVMVRVRVRVMVMLMPFTCVAWHPVYLHAIKTMNRSQLALNILDQLSILVGLMVGDGDGDGDGDFDCDSDG